jgi:aspartyl-tRNA(Asn)/glutamyl-tRNA(Gln) amidotransferase subunit C
MALSDEHVRRIARLARIALRPEEAAEALSRLNQVLGLIEEMRVVDTAGIEPMAHALDLSQRLRADRVTEADQRQVYQSIAPETEDGLYLVPKVLE